MTLSDKTRDIDLELAERCLQRPWEHIRKCPSLTLPEDAAGASPGSQGAPQGPRINRFRRSFVFMHLARAGTRLFWDELYESATRVFTRFCALQRGWLGGVR